MQQLFNSALEAIGDKTISLADLIGTIVTGDIPLKRYSTIALVGTICAALPVNAANNVEKPNPMITISLEEYIALTYQEEPVAKVVKANTVKKLPLTKKHLKAYRKVNKVVNQVTDDPFYREYLLFVARAESQYGLRQVSFTGAKGIWQFTGRTAKMYKLDDPFHPVKAAKAAKRLAQDNRRGLIVKGIEPTVKHTYYTHMIGLTGLTIVTKAAEGKPLTAYEKRKFNHVLGSNMTKPMLQKYFTGVGKNPVMRGKFTHQEVATAYLDLFEERTAQYVEDNHLLSQGKLS